jgi:hypothetical protein
VSYFAGQGNSTSHLGAFSGFLHHQFPELLLLLQVGDVVIVPLSNCNSAGCFRLIPELNPAAPNTNASFMLKQPE